MYGRISQTLICINPAKYIPNEGLIKVDGMGFGGVMMTPDVSKKDGISVVQNVLGQGDITTNWVWISCFILTVKGLALMSGVILI